MPTSPAQKIKSISTMFPACGNGRKRTILFGTVDSWLIWKMTGGAVPCHRLGRSLPHDALRGIPQPSVDDSILDVWGSQLYASGGCPRLQRKCSRIQAPRRVPCPSPVWPETQQAALLGRAYFDKGN